MKKYLEFSIWNNIEERPATVEEIIKAIFINILSEEYGKCEIVLSDGYSLKSEWNWNFIH